MSLVREKDEYSPSNRPHNRRQNHQQHLLRRLERRVVAAHAVGVQKHHDPENHQCAKRVHKVPDPKPVRREVSRRGIRPEADSRRNSVARHPVSINVAVGEGGEAAGEAAGGDQDPRRVLVDGAVAAAVVGEERVEVLEQEDCACGEEFDEVAYASEA